MSGKFTSAVVGGAVQRTIESPVLFLPVHLAVPVSAPARKRHKTFLHTQQKKHSITEGRNRADFELFYLATVHFARARSDDFGRLRTMCLDLIPVAVRIKNVQAPFAQGAE